MPLTIDYYRSLAEEMISKLGRLNHFTKHPGSIGTFHETILRSTIKQLLPARFSLKTGFVYDGSNVSNQIDILIIDENEPTSYFFQEGDFVVVHPDAVVCAIEVKTEIKQFNAFKESVENICSFKKLYISSARKPQGLIFCFDSINFFSSTKTVQKWWKQISAKSKDLYFLRLFSLKQGSFDLRNYNNRNWGHYFVMGEEEDPYKTKSLSIFLMIVRKLTEMQNGRFTGNPFHNAIMTGLKWSEQYLRYGVGLLS